MCKPYNGWTNYETWVVALWLDNEESTQGMVTQWAARAKDERALAEQLKTFINEGNPITEANLYADLLGSALGEVNWQEIAQHYTKEAADE